MNSAESGGMESWMLTNEVPYSTICMVLRTVCGCANHIPLPHGTLIVEDYSVLPASSYSRYARAAQIGAPRPIAPLDGPPLRA